MLLKILNRRQQPLDPETLQKIAHYLHKSLIPTPVKSAQDRPLQGERELEHGENCAICKSLSENIIPGEGHPVPAIGRMELEIYRLIDWDKFARNVLQFLGILKDFKEPTELNLKKAMEGDVPYKPDGKPFTFAEIQTINDFIRQELHIAPSAIETAIVRSFIIGNILETLQREKKEAEAMTLKLASLPKTIQEAAKKYSLTAQQIRSIEFSMLRTGEHITKISEQARQVVIKNVIDAQIEGKGSSQLAQDLFHEVTDTPGNLNRDWSRVARFEANFSSQSGFLGGCRPGEIVVIKSMPNACEFCKKYLDGKTFIVREGPPEDYSQFDPNSEKYKEIAKIWDQQVWIGKSNIGRSLSKRQRLEGGDYRNREHHELWSVAAPAHPSCRCYYVKEWFA